METKRYNLKTQILSILIMLLLVTPAISQQTEQQETKNTTKQTEETEKNYFAQQDGENTTLFQTIKWASATYAKWYEVLIEKQAENGQWKPFEDPYITTRDKTAEPTEQDQTQQPMTYVQNAEYLGEGLYKTTETQLVLCLSAKEDGSAQKYRYTITLFNLLEQAAFTTHPMEFEVKKAFIPEIHSISKELVYLDSIYDGNVTLRGINLMSNTQFTLTSGLRSIPLLQMETSSNNERADLVFDVEAFDTGSWTLKAENPGEFTAEIPFTIKFMKWYDLNISVGYAPQLAVADGTIKKYFGKRFIPLGVDARVTFIPIKRRFGYFGFAVDARASRISASYGGYDLATQFFHGTLLAVYKLPLLNKKLFLEARGGGGVTIVQGLQFSFPHDLKSEPFNSAYVAVQAGSSLSYNIWRGLYAEAGVDVIMSFIPDMPLLQVVPQIAVGWTL